MRKYAFLLLAVLFSCLVCGVHAQNQGERRIYLWDVTLSMSGFNGAPDIYDDVVRFLIRDISSLTDERTEIIVAPFQEAILESWTVKADEQGKRDIIDRIRSYRNTLETRTDIVTSVNQVKERFIDNDHNNMLILLTDGLQSNDRRDPATGELIKFFGGQKRLHEEVVDTWQTYGKLNNAYLLYVMLTSKAVDQEVVDKLDDKECSSVLYPADSAEVLQVVEMVELQPANRVKVNIKDGDGTVVIPFGCKKNIVLPDGIGISVKSAEGSAVAVDAKATVAGNRMTFALGQNCDSLRSQLGEHTDIALELRLLNGREIRRNTGKILIVNPVVTTLELINKREKILTIKIKK